MNAADLLRKDLVSINKKEFIDHVCKGIIRNKYYSITWGERTSVDDSCAFLNDYDLKPALEWVKEEGFKIECQRVNSWRREYYVTL